jgi:hypothetical protein
MYVLPKTIPVSDARKCRGIRANSSFTVVNASGARLMPPHAGAEPSSHMRESPVHRNSRRDTMTLTSTCTTKAHARVSRRMSSTGVEHIQSNASVCRNRSPMIAAASRGNVTSTLETTNAWTGIEVCERGSRSSNTGSRHQAPHQQSMSSAPIRVSRDSARLHANFESKTVSGESRAATLVC